MDRNTYLLQKIKETEDNIKNWYQIENESEIENKYYLESEINYLEKLKNELGYYIDDRIQKLVDSNIPFIFDQGGFENLQYGAIKNSYFEKFKKYQSKKNLWNYCHNRPFRPYYHLIDNNITDEIAQYYCNLIHDEL